MYDAHPNMVSRGHSADIGILGAGIMGCCLALELARRGFRVDLIDLAPTPMTGASLHNEGKLHLGFVYAKDPLKKTHGMMLRGSLAFSRILEKLTGCGADSLMPSQSFHYFVPVDSQLGMDAIDDHFQRVEEEVHEETRSSGNLYMDRRVDRYHERNSPSDHSSVFSHDLTLGSFKTQEISVSPVAVAAILRRAIDRQPGVNFVGNTEVLAADRLAGGDVEVESRLNGKTSKNRYPSAANCLWDDRLRIDRTAGIRDHGPWILRYKATINFSAPTAAHGNIPSATGIIGSYGDVVNQNNGSYYVSWYPLTKIAQSVDGYGRELHDMVHKGIVSRCIRKVTSRDSSISRFVASITHRRFIDGNIRGMAAFIPSMTALLTRRSSSEVGGGVILARGATDIDDPTSYLHRRAEIGPVAHGSYVTIDTGKYCMAPLFALQAADMITDVLK
jgi:hypothetical protein